MIKLRYDVISIIIDICKLTILITKHNTKCHCNVSVYNESSVMFIGGSSLNTHEACQDSEPDLPRQGPLLNNHHHCALGQDGLFVWNTLI